MGVTLPPVEYLPEVRLSLALAPLSSMLQIANQSNSSLGKWSWFLMILRW